MFEAFPLKSLVSHGNNFVDQKDFWSDMYCYRYRPMETWFLSSELTPASGMRNAPGPTGGVVRP